MNCFVEDFSGFSSKKLSKVDMNSLQHHLWKITPSFGPAMTLTASLEKKLVTHFMTVECKNNFNRDG